MSSFCNKSSDWSFNTIVEVNKNGIETVTLGH